MLIRIQTTVLAFLFVSTSFVWGQDSLSEQIKEISDHLENLNSNEFIASNIFTFSYAKDTLRVHYKKVWKYDFVEEYLEVIPLKNIKTIQAEKFYGANSLIFTGKSLDEGFVRHIIHENRVVPSTHLFVSSDGDELSFKRIQSLLQQYINSYLK